jgi:hypothetical protein
MNLRQLIKNPTVTLVAGLVIGTIFGLFVLGWYVWPVEWIDASPAALSAEWQDEFLRMSIELYSLNGDVTAAQNRYGALGDAGPEALERVKQNPAPVSMDAITAFETNVVPSMPLPPAEEEQGFNWIYLLVGVICLIFVVIVVLVVVFLLRGRAPQTEGLEPTPAMQAAEARKQARMTDYAAESEQAPPVSQFMASYKLGDDLFDDSFSIDSPAGEFLGECGVSISETVGVGDPKKGTAFEVWLFDKNDIQTVTKVLMSAHAFEDSAINQRLQAKGEPVLADPETEFVLETQTLQMVARVVNMGYGEGAMPEESYFDQLLLELAIWQK